VSKIDIESQLSSTVDGVHHIVLAENRNYLQISLKNLEKWSTKCNMQLNENKTKELILIKKRHVHLDNLLFGNNVKVPKANSSERVLGVHIDEHLTFSDHVNKIVSTVTPRLYWLKKLKSVGIDELSLILIYKTHHRSVIAYAAPAWFPHTGEVSRDKLEKLQKSALKRINSNKSYEEALAYYNLPTMRSFLKKSK
jgi:hypothetical protein